VPAGAIEPLKLTEILDDDIDLLGKKVMELIEAVNQLKARNK